jgi:preprotein translocase subunit SecA
MEELLKSIQSNLNPDQIRKLNEASEKLVNSKKTLTREDAIKVFEDLGIDIDGLKKNYDEARMIKKATKIMPNEKCPCGSGKKYKKCCRK